MTANLAEMRNELAVLVTGHARGDVPRPTYEKKSEKLILAMAHEAARQILEPGEDVQDEHHAVLAHTKITSSLLKEGDQELVSVYATDRRLVSVRTLSRPGRAVSMDEGDTHIDSILYDEVRKLTTRREVRWGEAAAGAVSCVVAVIFASALSVTGTALFVLGLAGILHALLLPTRWVEVDGPPGAEPIRIYALRRKTARRLLRGLRRRIHV